MLDRPLKLNVPTQYYSKLYTSNHPKFCKRFIATIFHHYFTKFLDSCVRNNITSELLAYELTDTDNYLCLVRENIDDFYSHTTVREAIMNDSIIDSLETLVVDIISHRKFMNSIFT